MNFKDKKLDINDLTKKPAMFLAGVLEKVDNRLFDLIYGPQEDNDGTRLISGLLFKNLKQNKTPFALLLNILIIGRGSFAETVLDTFPSASVAVYVKTCGPTLEVSNFSLAYIIFSAS